jgi:uncharacterized membrane protein
MTEWINENPGKAAGAIAGFVLGILILTIGFVKTLLIILFIVAGVIIGKMRDDRFPIFEQITGLFGRKKKRDDDDLE